MASFPLTPDYTFTEGIDFKTKIVTFESGTEQRHAKWASGKRRFTCDFTNRSNTDWTTFKNFYIARKGAYDSFTFTNPNDSTAYTVRFASDSVDFSKDTPAAVKSWSCVLVEVT